MKRVSRLRAEPSGLAAYRRANPSEDNAPPSEAGQVWSRFKNEAGEGYRALLDELARAQQGLCGYCEQRLTICNGERVGKLVFNNYQVEHVHPKTGGGGQTLDWTNMLLVCVGGSYRHAQDPSRYLPGGSKDGNISCGQWKDHHELPVGTDPRDLPWRKRVVDVDMEGRISPAESACFSPGVEARALDECITLLNLNAERLRVARKKIAENLRGWIVPILEELLADSHATGAQKQEMHDLYIKARLQPDATGHLKAFWTVERACLPGADDWILRNSTLFGFE